MLSEQGRYRARSGRTFRPTGRPMERRPPKEVSSTVVPLEGGFVRLLGHGPPLMVDSTQANRFFDFLWT